MHQTIYHFKDNILNLHGFIKYHFNKNIFIVKSYDSPSINYN